MAEQKYTNIPRKCHNQEAEPSWGTKKRRDEEQTMTKQIPHETITKKEVLQPDGVSKMLDKWHTVSWSTLFVQANLSKYLW